MSRFGFLEILGSMLRHLYGPPDGVEEKPSMRNQPRQIDTRAASSELREAAGHLKQVAQMTTAAAGGDKRLPQARADDFELAMREFSDRIR